MYRIGRPHNFSDGYELYGHRRTRAHRMNGPGYVARGSVPALRAGKEGLPAIPVLAGDFITRQDKMSAKKMANIIETLNTIRHTFFSHLKLFNKT